jgi:hypothetical protein
LLDLKNIVGAVFFKESGHMTIRKLLDPIGRLIHSILDRDNETWGLTIIICFIAWRAVLARE